MIQQEDIYRILDLCCGHAEPQDMPLAQRG
jgi:hypothetical protein